VTSPKVTLPAFSSHVFYQGDPAGQGLKADCYGSAVIRSSDGGVLAIVNEAINSTQTAAAYNAFAVEQAGTTVVLPLVRKNHARGLTTGISVMNVGATEAEVALSITTWNPDGSQSPVGCPVACSRTVGASDASVKS
jgi:hypothetical protein